MLLFILSMLDSKEYLTLLYYVNYEIQTPNEAFLQWFANLLGLGRQIGLINFGVLSALFWNCEFFVCGKMYFSNLLEMRNLQEQVKKAFCYQKLFWPFTVWMNCSRDLKNFANSWPSASNFKSFSRSLEQFFLTVGQNNFGNKIPFLHSISQIMSN